MPNPCKNNSFDGSEQGDSGGFSANQSKPWCHGEHFYYAGKGNSNSKARLTRGNSKVQHNKTAPCQNPKREYMSI